MGRDSANVCIIEHRERGGSETLPAVTQSNRQPMISRDDEVLLLENFFHPVCQLGAAIGPLARTVFVATNGLAYIRLHDLRQRFGS